MHNSTSGKDKHVFPLLASCVPSDAVTQNVSGGQRAKLQILCIWCVHIISSKCLSVENTLTITVVG